MSQESDPSGRDGRAFLVVAAGGWGSALARAMAERAGRVVLCDGSGSGPASGDGADARLATFPADVTSETGVEALFEFALARLERLDALVVAPTGPAPSALADLTAGAWDDALGRGLRAPFLLCSHAIHEWLATGAGGRIVIVPPPVRAGEPAQACAAAVQEALVSLARSIAKEYGARGVSCNVLVRSDEEPAPGPPLHGVIEAVLFLASPEASYLTGEIVRVGAA